MSDQFEIDPNLRQFATETQKKWMDAIKEYGGVRAAGRALNTDHSAIIHAINRLKRNAEARGYSPDHDYIHPTPTSFVAKGVSTLYVTDKKTGTVRVGQQWVKSRLDDAQWQEAVKAAMEAMSEELPRLAPLERKFSVTNEHLLNLYTMTDCHVGMLAWRHEGGDDWDLKIAKDVLFGCFEQMILKAPNAAVGVINQLGDFLHTDGLQPITPTGHNVLDADGRFQKMVGTAVTLIRRMIDLALMKHEKVIVLLAEGNHDMASSVWLRVMFKALYENEPRVEVIESALPYYAIQHGKTMLGFHHGHLKKPDMLAPVMAAQFAPIWGLTTHRYAHMGHIHEFYSKEHHGMLVTQHPTLAGRDAYAARGGWFGDRSARAITYHDIYGQVAENVVRPEMLHG